MTDSRKAKAKPKAKPKAKRKAKKTIGRPSAYTAKIAAAVCAGLAEGKSISKVCADEKFPCVATVYNWIRNEDGFLEQYQRAREDQADHYADQIIEIADSTEDPAKARVQIDARKWVSSKLKPKSYGDKLEVEAVITTYEIPTDSDPASAADLYKKMIS